MASLDDDITKRTTKYVRLICYINSQAKSIFQADKQSLNDLFFSGIKDQQELFEAIEKNEYLTIQEVVENSPKRSEIYRFDNVGNDAVIYKTTFNAENFGKIQSYYKAMRNNINKVSLQHIYFNSLSVKAT